MGEFPIARIEARIDFDTVGRPPTYSINRCEFSKNRVEFYPHRRKIML